MKIKMLFHINGREVKSRGSIKKDGWWYFRFDNRYNQTRKFYLQIANGVSPSKTGVDVTATQGWTKVR